MAFEAQFSARVDQFFKEMNKLTQLRAIK